MGALYPSRIHTPRVHTRQGGRTKASAATRSSVASEVSRIVSAASLDTQGRGAVQSLYFDGMIYARRVRVRRAVSNDVLTADVLRNCGRDRLHFVKTGREKCSATGLLGERSQGLTIGVVATVILLEGNRVEHRSILGLQLAKDLLESSLAGVVLTIRHHQQNLLRERGSLVEMIDRSDDGVVKRRAAGRIDMLQGGL